MKNVAFLLLFFASFNPTAFSQVFSWAKSFSGNSLTAISSTATDSVGNVYVTGIFAGTVDFDTGPGIYNITALSTSTDAFFAKYNAAGDFIWAKSIGGPQIDRGQGITLDKQGFIYLTGTFRGTADLDPGPSVLNYTAQGTQATNGDIYIIKLTNTGDIVWVKVVGGTADENPEHIEVDQSNNVIVSTQLIGLPDYDPGPSVLTISGTGVGLIKLDNSGNLIWAGGLVVNGSSLQSYHFTLDKSGNIYIAGYFYGTADFDPGNSVYNLTSNGESDLFVCKLSSGGNFVWARSVGNSDRQNAGDVALDSSGNVYITGWFTGRMDFDPGAGVDMVSFNGGSEDFYLWKLSNNGDHQCVRTIGGSGSDVGIALATDQEGSVYVYGGFTGTVDVDPGPLVLNFTTSSPSVYESFITKFDPRGKLQWARKTESSNTTSPQTIVLTGRDQLVMTGYLTGTTDFDPGAGVQSLSSSGANTVFIWKLSKASLITGTIFSDMNGDGIRQVNEFALPLMVKGARSGLAFYTIADSTGFYQLEVDTGSYAVSVVLPPYYSTSIPGTHMANFASTFGGYDGNNDFAVRPVANINDLVITGTAITPARAGRQSSYRITYANHGTTVLSGSVRLQLDGRSLFNLALPAVNSQVGSLLNWNFSGLLPWQTKNIDIVVNLATSLFINDTLRFFASILPMVNDTTQANNADTILHRVIASFDPNDKQVLPTGDILPSFITEGRSLDYTVRFQNTGNDTAFLVVLRDTLNPLLDWNTFEMVAASHNYTFQLEKNGAVEWRFANILLPDSTRNEVRSHGFVRYRIKPKTLQPGNVVKNKASIYFDYNPPVVTNETLTALRVVTGIVVIAPDVVSRVYPNPTRGMINIMLKGRFVYRVLDLLGRVVVQTLQATDRAEINTSQLLKGIYVIEIETKKGNAKHKIIIE